MKLVIAVAALFLAGSLCQGATASSSAGQKKSAHSTKSSSSHASTRATSKRRTRRVAYHRRPRGQQKIDTTRTRDIQEALAREHYLDGTPTGKWDSKTQAALVRYQADNGWQTKVVPDSRALIKLGLGPDHDHLLNPETAMTSSLATAHEAPAAAEKASAAPDAASAGTHPQQ